MLSGWLVRCADLLDCRFHCDAVAAQGTRAIGNMGCADFPRADMVIFGDRNAHGAIARGRPLPFMEHIQGLADGAVGRDSPCGVGSRGKKCRASSYRLSYSSVDHFVSASADGSFASTETCSPESHTIA